MWYLYKRQLPSGSPISKRILESDNLDNLKREAEKLARNDGCSDHSWGHFIEPGVQKSYEMVVDNKYKFIIREW
jgi:hypothetical protein